MTRGAEDDWGLSGRQTPRLLRMLELLGSTRAFRPAAAALEELLGVRLGAETTRRAVHREGRRAEAWLDAGDAAADAAFAGAEGRPELLVDAVKVNTTTGWRDLKMELWLKREAGNPALPAAWKTRRLPPPTARRVLVAIGEAQDFTADWAAQARTLAIDLADLAVVADGGEWIWNGRREHLPGSDGLLDVFHASQRLHETAATLLGEKTPAARAWGESATETLIRDGWDGLCQLLDEALAEQQAKRGTRKSREAQTALHGTRAYFFSRRGELDYRGRLAAGRSIGSGAIEGEAKQQGKRLKVGRWLPENAVRIGSLLAIHHAGIRREFHAAA